MSKKESSQEAIALQQRKLALRNEMRRRRRAADPEWILRASERIQAAVIALPEFVASQSLGCYLALPYEVQTRAIIEAAWFGNKRVCVPAWNEREKRYEMTWFGREDRTRAGRWNICEPEAGKRAGCSEVDLLIVPALAFDPRGGRLGHGGGHFDRLLGAWAGIKVGIGFQFQIQDETPMGSQDVPVDLVVTEQGIYAGGERRVQHTFEKRDQKEMKAG